MGKHVCKDEQIKLIMECRSSGLSDYRWCEQNGIHLGNFYNQVSKLKKKGYTFPEPASKTKPVPNIQEVVKVDLVDFNIPGEPTAEQNASILSNEGNNLLAVEIMIGKATLRLYNGADAEIINNALRCIGGMSHAW